MKTKFSECTGMEVEIGTTRDKLGDCLGEGAEGAVYDLEQFDEYVAKIFKEDKREHKRTKVQQMVEDHMVSPKEQIEIPWTAWPLELVSAPSDGSFLGYAMPYLDTDQYIDAQRYASQELRWDTSSQRQRYKPAINLTLTVYWLHQNGYAIGDLAEQNIRVNDGTVTLIDCDSYSIEESDFAGMMEAPRYTPPEGRGTTHEGVRQTDQFGVAVHIFQFLMEGFHPYQAVGSDSVGGPLPEAIKHGTFPYSLTKIQDVAPPPPAPDLNRLPTSVRHGFEQCFADGQKNPSARPSLEKWLAILSKESEFDVEGIDPSDAEFDDAEQENLGRNWQEEIRQKSNSSDRPQPILTRTPSRTETTASPSSGDDTHWADNIRGPQTARSSGNNRQQAGGQQSTGQGSNEGMRRGEKIVIAAMVVFLLVILIFSISQI